MAFSPEEIEGKEFLIALRGYDRAEVRSFLRAVAVDVRAMRAASWARDGIESRAVEPSSTTAGAAYQTTDDDAARRVGEEAERQAADIVGEAIAEAARLRGAAAVKLDLAERQAAELLEDARREAELLTGHANPTSEAPPDAVIEIGNRLRTTIESVSRILQRVTTPPAAP